MTIPAYSAASLSAIGHLKRNNNDISIFVEDEACKTLWVNFLRKHLPIEIKLESITPLGSRERVVETCKQFKPISGGVPAMFIIDADMDLICVKRKPANKRLYRLNVYCLENHLICSDALSKVATIFKNNITETEAKEDLKLEEWLSLNNELLIELFTCYAIVLNHTKNDVELPKTVKYSIVRLLDDNEVNLCSRKVSERIQELYKQLNTELSFAEVKTKKRLYKNRLAEMGVLKGISAKDYIFPIIIKKMKNNFSCNINQTALKTLIVKELNDNIDPKLTKKINEVLSE